MSTSHERDVGVDTINNISHTEKRITILKSVIHAVIGAFGYDE
jgi:hypothetical protein